MRSDAIANSVAEQTSPIHDTPLTCSCKQHISYSLAALAMMSVAADQTGFSISPGRDRRKYLSWERSKAAAAAASRPRRRSCSLTADEGPTSSGPQIAVVFDVVASSRVGRILRRRFTEVCRRSRLRHRPSRPPCKTDGSPTEFTTFIRHPRPADASTAYSTMPQQSSVFAADHRPPLCAAFTVTQPTWSRTTTRQTTTLTTETTVGPSTTATAVSRVSTADSIVSRADNMTTSTASLRDQITSFFQVSDNKLAMKLFGNKNALEKEKLRHKAVGHWVIHPCSDFRSSLHS